MLLGKSAQRYNLPFAKQGLDCVTAALSRNHNVFFRRYTRGHIARPIALVTTDWLVTIKIQPVGNFPLHIEHRNRAVGDAELRKPFLHRPC